MVYYRRVLQWCIGLIVMSPFSYSNSNFALRTNLFDGRIRKRTEEVCYRTQRRSSGTWRHGSSRKYIMPKQHVASLKSDYAIPLAERERICLEMTDTRVYDRDHSHDGALMAPQYRSYLEKHSSVRLRVSSTLKHPPCVDRRLRFCF